MEASEYASARLSPSKANLKSAAIGMDQSAGSDESTRRVIPPPGMKGIWDSFSTVRFCGTGEVYRGIGKTVSWWSGVEDRDFAFGCN